MVLVSEGIDYDIYNLFDNNSAASTIIDATRDAIAAATRGNVSIYAIDPARAGHAGRRPDRVVRCRRPTNRTSDSASNRRIDELRLSQDSLRALADETGGFAAVNQQQRRRGVRPHRRATTAATTCSGTTRPTTSATAGSARLTSASRGPG